MIELDTDHMSSIVNLLKVSTEVADSGPVLGNKFLLTISFLYSKAESEFPV